MQNANALEQIAGRLVISVPIGGSNSTQYGLINDENETITVSLRAEGNVAKYLSFPETVDLPVNKIIYTNITAKVPPDYNVSLGRNITGFVYALQEGKPGQVKINIQMKKSVTITILEQTAIRLEQASPITGFSALVSANSIVVILIVVLVVTVFTLIKIKKRGGEKE